VIDKLRWDAFHFTELEPILRNLGTRRLIIAGLQTNVCVETTARTAMMRNFEVAVPEDAVSTDGFPCTSIARRHAGPVHRGRTVARADRPRRAMGPRLHHAALRTRGAARPPDRMENQ